MAKSREDKVKSLRLLEIDRIIREGGYPNAPQLEKKFEVSRSTIMRDLEFLRDRYNAPLEYDADKNGYYYTDPTFFIKSVMLSEGELFTVSAIIPLLEQYKNTPLEASFKSIFQKITDMLPEEVSVNSSFAAGGIQFISDPLPNIDNLVFNTVFKAVKLRVSMDFLYRSLGKQEYSPRCLDPYQVICQKGNWYVIGYCHKAGAVRIYSLSRMKKIACTKKQFKVPADFDIKKHVDPNFGVWNNPTAPVKVELLFSKEISTYILERNWHEGQKMKQNKDGTVYLSFKSNQMQETLFWVLHFGSAVKVLSPPELADRVKAEARKIAKQY